MVPTLLRFLAVNCAIGVAAGWTFLAMLIWQDVAGLRRLIASSSAPEIPAIMLIVMFAITFGAAAMGTAVLMLPKDDEDEGGL